MSQASVPHSYRIDRHDWPIEGQGVKAALKHQLDVKFRLVINALLEQFSFFWRANLSVPERVRCD
ncbi:MAG: hypothetical protein RJB60_902 [Pseudomonadota bacterium]|jgi:hypothetical protein